MVQVKSPSLAPDSKLATDQTPELQELPVFKNKIPANWTINIVDENTISAQNTVTQEYFEGTIKEFNDCLRG
jgi:hypothetical protein